MIADQKVRVVWSGYNKKHYISKGYNFTKAGEEFLVDPKDLPVSATVFIPFICDYCNGKNQTDEKSKYKSTSNYYRHAKLTGKDCCNNPICRNIKRKESFTLKLQREGRTLKDIFPDVAREWSDKNENTPFDYSPSSGQIVFWKCSKGHEWKSSICNRTTGKRGCPYCAGKATCIDNCLVTTHSELSKEWHPTKNDTLTPESVSKGSNEVAWWLGKCGHEWDDTVCHRTSGVGCPFCSGKRVDKNNCLATRDPDLANEWDREKNKNLTPYTVTANSNKIAWWRCSKCSHSWKAIISNRIKGVGCPVCNESKGEKRIRKWLETNNVLFEPQKEFNGLTGTGGGLLSFDFYLPLINILIEYQGEFHDGSGHKNSYTKINLEKQREHDKRKREYAKSNGFKFIEIWYCDFDNIENILQNKLY